MTEPVIGDALGEVLHACWAGGGAPGVAYEVVERDDGYVFARDAYHYFGLPGEWTELERLACRRAGGRVLDVGCGAGRHAVVLAAEGTAVVGIDISPGAVAVTRERGVQAECGDVARLGGDLGRFDTFLLLDNNLGLLGSAEHAPVVLAELARHAAPGARLYGTGADPYVAIPSEIAYQDRNRRLGRMPGQARLRVRAGHLATGWFDYLGMTPDELAQVIDGTGWALTDVTTEDMSYLAELTFTARI
ncbi:class I SAM-dependent methyltransferase [Actinokineospora auranticolor]|uniref:Methyltransferase family protein n=1 Tax=Actinokineospora auranticolor TaxID=155976 RepID=A0A2S6GK10_9PSEU|nr:class I SAM-dependent methyltransferase [Actinokineospora auranticolor]PPK65549.1 methyltransferase family protein [Actinokineospora auranticolor]